MSGDGPVSGGGPVSDRHFNRFPGGLPDRLLDLDDLSLLEELGRPTLIRVPGAGEERPRAVACLLHGDEDTGYCAVLRILRRRRTYPFDLYVVIGNVQAALADGGFRHRYLDGQEDFNRIWGLPPTTRQRLAADGMLGELRAAGIGALVDVHNNSGANPFYAIVTRLREDSINLATTFTTTLLLWELGVHTLMEALDDVCPAVAVECGRPGRSDALSFAVDGLRRYLGPATSRDRLERDFDLLGDLLKVTVRREVRFTFGGDLGQDVDFVVEQDADAHNFRRVPAGHVLGRIPDGEANPLVVCGPGGEDVTDRFVAVSGGEVVLTRPVTPVMMTRTAEAARRDCIFYIATEMPATSLVDATGPSWIVRRSGHR
ncbi:MAG TPA: hypothetical protein VHF25_05970 [Nitriliruptorales bacterium]|nr:hypothetical protein [Nitriliruptorales bacterium]